METLDFWRFLAGIGLFLFGMNRMEGALGLLAGKRFKLYLRHFSRNRFMAIFNGALVTAFFQSSSLVVLLVIAFSGAGILSLPNALGIILGANLGTTFTGWLVSILGFKVSLESFVMPLLASGAIGMALFRRRGPIQDSFSFLFYFSLVFMGLSFVKDSMGTLATHFPLALFQQLGGWSFFLFGLVVTALIQSSSAMMTLCLAALHANIITLIPAALIVVGANLGTTITGLVAAMQGTPIKKRVALAHFLVNLVSGVLALLLLTPLLSIIETTLQIVDPLIALVSFHSGFNFLGILIFAPFLGQFEKLLRTFFTKDSGFHCKFIHKVDSEVPEAALVALENEVRLLLKDSFSLNQTIFGFSKKSAKLGISHFLLGAENEMQRYELLKKREGEILEYCLKIQTQALDSQEASHLSALTEACRKSIQSVKAAIDIHHNFEEFRESIVEIVESTLSRIEENYRTLMEGIESKLAMEQKNAFQEFPRAQWEEQNHHTYHEIKAWLYKSSAEINAADQEVATFLNVNREIFLSNRYFLEALGSLQGSSLRPLPTSTPEGAQLQ